MKLIHVTQATPTFMVRTLEGVHPPSCMCTKFEADRSIRSKGPIISKLGHMTQATPTYGVILWFVRRKGPSSICAPNLKRIAQLVQKLDF